MKASAPGPWSMWTVILAASYTWQAFSHQSDWKSPPYLVGVPMQAHISCGHDPDQCWPLMPIPSPSLTALGIPNRHHRPALASWTLQVTPWPYTGSHRIVASRLPLGCHQQTSELQNAIKPCMSDIVSQQIIETSIIYMTNPWLSPPSEWAKNPPHRPPTSHMDPGHPSLSLGSLSSAPSSLMSSTRLPPCSPALTPSTSPHMHLSTLALRSKTKEFPHPDSQYPNIT